MPESQLEVFREANLILPGLPSCEDHSIGFCSRFPSLPLPNPGVCLTGPPWQGVPSPVEISEYKSSPVNHSHLLICGPCLI